MRLIFAGSPEFAVPALAALLDAGHDVVQVLAQPDRPAGRGMKLKPGPVKALALARGLAVYQPETLKTAESQVPILCAQADAMVVAAYGLILPRSVLETFPRGCFNIHASLLPRWRGAAPIQRAMLAGDGETGVTIMQVVPALDAGPVLNKIATPILPHDTAGTLQQRLATLGAQLMVETLSGWATLTPQPQDEMQVTYAEKLHKEEAILDWREAAVLLARRVHAFNPFPVARAFMRGEAWRIWRADAALGAGVPGTVLDVGDGMSVACGDGVLNIHTLQRPGGNPLPVREFLAGCRVRVGDCFDAP